MDNNKIKAKEQQAPSISSKSTIAQQGTTSAANAIDKLKEYGGFTFLENIIDGFSNLNPTRKARRNIFLSDAQWENERKVLANRLEVWIDLLKSGQSAEQMRDKAKERALHVEDLLNKNLSKVLARTRELETSYRSVALFYRNTESQKVKNITIVNAEMDQLTDLDNPVFIDYISNELKHNFDRLDLVVTILCLSSLDIWALTLSLTSGVRLHTAIR